MSCGDDGTRFDGQNWNVWNLTCRLAELLNMGIFQTPGDASNEFSWIFGNNTFGLKYLCGTYRNRFKPHPDTYEFVCELFFSQGIVSRSLRMQFRCWWLGLYVAMYPFSTFVPVDSWGHNSTTAKEIAWFICQEWSLRIKTTLCLFHWARYPLITIPTFDGRNAAPPGMYKNPVTIGISYQPQLVSQISSINRMTLKSKQIISNEWLV